ncbi:helix-turn-helix transcriptional regulator [Bdellovibrionota bacterium FG-1]
MDLKKRFGTVLRQYRNARNLSQEELAFRSNVDRTFVSMLERGVKQPTLTTLFALAKALGCPVSDLIRQVELVSRKK